MDDALDELHGRGLRAPCETRADLFFSSRRVQRRDAVKLCADCPVIELCRAYALEAFEGLASAAITGVWGGIDYSGPKARHAA
jgi:hypothetical protein